MKRSFCTYFDQHYMSRALALYSSLRRHHRGAELAALCMDDTAYEVLVRLRLPGLHPIALEEFERNDPGLVEAKHNRSVIEYYFTCTPSLPLYVFRHFPEVQTVTYLDADLYFFADPAPLLDEVRDNSIAIVAHRFPESLRHLESRGIYNVGWLTFRRDEHALACLHWWRERCLEWCYDRVEAGRYADQKYLDDWPTRFENVAMLRSKGANLAPWNLLNYDIVWRSDQVLVDGEPLVFFHFHGLKQVKGPVHNPNLATYKANPVRAVRRHVYAPYLRELRRASKTIATSLSAVEAPRVVPTGIRSSSYGSHHARPPIRRAARSWLRSGFEVLRGKYFVMIGGRMLWSPLASIARGGLDRDD